MKHPRSPSILRLVLSSLVLFLDLPLLFAQDVQDPNGPITHSISSQTVVSSPEDRTRRTVGVGEEVTLTLAPGHKATWTITGKGKINGGTTAVSRVNTVTFTAPDTTPLKTAATATSAPVYDPEKTTITANCEEDDEGEDSTIEITTIRPSSVAFFFESWTRFNGQPLSYDFLVKVIVRPETVNFMKIKIYEDECTADTTGFFDQFDAIESFVKHKKSLQSVGMERHIQDGGTLMIGTDNLALQTAPPQTPYKGYTAGVFKWSIPSKYELNGDQGEFAKAVFVGELKVDPDTSIATFSADKNGPQASITEDGQKQP